MRTKRMVWVNHRELYLLEFVLTKPPFVITAVSTAEATAHIFRSFVFRSRLIFLKSYCIITRANKTVCFGFFFYQNINKFSIANLDTRITWKITDTNMKITNKLTHLTTMCNCRSTYCSNLLLKLFYSPSKILVNERFKIDKRPQTSIILGEFYKTNCSHLLITVQIFTLDVSK
jgi:hypothetical protein